jgi:hypothetical protein
MPYENQGLELQDLQEQAELEPPGVLLRRVRVLDVPNGPASPGSHVVIDGR